MKDQFRLAVINSHPIQYFAPLYAYLNTVPGLEVTALYCSDFSLRGATDPGFGRKITWDVDLLAGYRSVFLGVNASKRTPSGFWSIVCPEIRSEIRRGQYDAVLIHGYGYAAYVLALITAKTSGVPVLMRTETHLGLRRAGWKRRVRDAILAIGYRFVDGFLSIGTANREYYRSLGIPAQKLFDVPYSVDNERFTSGSDRVRAQRDATRGRFEIPVTDVVVLYASKFTRRKHPDDLIRAVAQIRDHQRPVTLLMIGAGGLEGELRDLASQLGMRNVIFGGFVNQIELPEVYAACDIFVLPSENEPWGLVVNEVMCAGLPVIVSHEVGCVADLVHDGVNGYRVRAGDVNGLAVAVARLLEDEPLRKRMGSASRSIMERWGYEQCREGTLAALSRVARDS